MRKNGKHRRESYPDGSGLDYSAGWRQPGQTATARRVQWRHRFMESAINASPQMAGDFLALHPLAIRIKAALQHHSKSAVDWGNLLDDASQIAAGRSDLDEEAQQAISAFVTSLSAWIVRYNLTSPPAVPPDIWVGVLAAQSLFLAMGTPVFPSGMHLYQTPYDATRDKLEIRLRPWSAGESAVTWHASSLREVDRQLREHVAAREAALVEAGYERIPDSYTRGLENIVYAARWQVLGEDWDTFLIEADLNDRSVPKVKATLTRILREIGIEPRAGMRT